MTKVKHAALQTLLVVAAFLSTEGKYLWAEVPTIHVATASDGGSDSNDGSAAAPVLTFAKAVNMLSGTDAGIIMLDSAYYEVTAAITLPDLVDNLTIDLCGHSVTATFGQAGTRWIALGKRGSTLIKDGILRHTKGGYMSIAEDMTVTFDNVETNPRLSVGGNSTIVVTNGAAVSNSSGYFSGNNAQVIVEKDGLFNIGNWNSGDSKRTVSGTKVEARPGSTVKSSGLINWGAGSYVAGQSVSNNIVANGSTLDFTRTVYPNGLLVKCDDSVFAVTNGGLVVGAMAISGDRNRFLIKNSFFTQNSSALFWAGTSNVFDISGGVITGGCRLSGEDIFYSAVDSVVSNGIGITGNGVVSRLSNTAGPLSFTCYGTLGDSVLLGHTYEKRSGTSSIDAAYNKIKMHGSNNTVRLLNARATDNTYLTISDGNDTLDNRTIAGSRECSIDVSNYVGHASLDLQKSTNLVFRMTDSTIYNSSQLHYGATFAGVSNSFRIVNSAFQPQNSANNTIATGGIGCEVAFQGVYPDPGVMHDFPIKWLNAGGSGSRVVFSKGYTVTNSQYSFTGSLYNFPATCTNCMVVLDDARISCVKALTIVSAGSYGCAVEIRGAHSLLETTATSKSWTSGSNSGTLLPWAPAIRFVLPRDGWAEAPVKGGAGATFYGNTRIEVDKGDWKASFAGRRQIPLISFSSKPTQAPDASALTAAGKLPAGAAFVYDSSDYTVYVEMPGPTGTRIIVN